jgi:protein TonB
VKRLWLCLAVLLVHLSLIAVAVTWPTAPEAAPVATAIQGVIIPVPVSVTAQQPKAEARPQPKPVKAQQKTPVKQAKPQKKAAKKAATSSKPLATAPIAEASPRAVSVTEAGTTQEKSQAQVQQTEAEPQISAPVAIANTSVNKAPLYPQLSRRLKEQGTVYLQVLVLKNGTVAELKIKQSSGFSRLDQSALNAVRHWTYRPALKLGQPVDFWFVQPVVFNLNSNNE